MTTWTGTFSFLDLFKLRPSPQEEWQPFLHNSFGIFQNHQRFNVVLHFSPERSRWIKGEVWHEGQTEEMHDDGSLVLTIPASHEAEITMEILKHGAHVVILEPDWLRKIIASEIARMFSHYQDREPEVFL